ncbi:MAG: FAD-dependent oxidoreductase [Thermoleophilaceae bacterium]
MSARRIVVVGGGIAGQTLCETLRERDSDVEITLVCAEEHLPYDRVHLSELLVSDAPVAERLGLRPEEWYADQDVTVLTGTRVERLDTRARTLETADGRTLEYDGLALATGSNALVPPFPGMDLEGVHLYRTPADCDAIREGARGATHAAVIGGGLLGLEAARGIQAQECPVTVVHLRDRLMERQLDVESAGLLLPAMRELDMEVELERQTECLLGEERVEGLRFKDGATLDADLVVVSIGIRSEVSLAEAADLDCNRGILVDDRMITSETGVVAVGECAEHRGRVYGLVAPIYEQARVAADTLLEVEAGAEYHGSIPWAKLKVAEVDLVSIGNVDGDASAVTIDQGGRAYRKLVTREGRASGAILMGDTRGTEAVLEAIRTTGEVADPLEWLTEAAQAGPEDLADEAQVCDCNGVCKGRSPPRCATRACRACRRS